MTERVILSCLVSSHEKIAADMLGDTGAELKCHVCERTESVDVSQAAVYLRKGWPVCCGQTMSLISLPKGGGS